LVRETSGESVASTVESLGVMSLADVVILILFRVKLLPLRT
jgi:hypothetical protein